MSERRSSGVDIMPGLGAALTQLGIEDKFLQNGALAQFPLAQRGAIAQEIIDEKLRTGDWQTVIRMIYGGFGKADALYDGDHAALRDRIMESALAHPQSFLEASNFDALAHRGQNELLYRLATELPDLTYTDIHDISSRITEEFYADEQHGTERSHTIHTLLARKALDNGNYRDAFTNFAIIHDLDGISLVFDTWIKGSRSSGDISLLEHIAKADPAHTEERIKQLIFRVDLSYGSASSVFQLYQRHKPQFTQDEQKRFMDMMAKNLSYYDIDKQGVDPDLQLRWAKEHARSDPKAAYQIMKQLNHRGKKIIDAVNAAIALHVKDPRGGMHVFEIDPDLCRAVYDGQPESIQIDIARHLKDSTLLRKHSFTKLEQGDYYMAYRLWIESGGSMSSDELHVIRAKLITESMGRHSRPPLERNDIPGHIQAYDAFMEVAQGKPSLAEEAYKIALNMNDDERMQRARDMLVASSPTWALNTFREKHDTKGAQMALNKVAADTGADPGKLMELVELYAVKH
ncbi:hypothetical protein J4464_02880 [Candidatus Woesearchaeota archaeon]|nr:hypothetical protein [Candidatus Woesearchaeota archaeon]